MSRSRAGLAALATLAACWLIPFGAQAQQSSSTAPTIKFIITHPADGLLKLARGINAQADDGISSDDIAVFRRVIMRMTKNLDKVG